jgi:hypothetical protein
MSLGANAWISNQEAAGIHLRLLANDPVAPADLACAFLEPLVNWLVRNNASVDPHICATAAENAILNLIKNPNSYDPDRSMLPAYLRMSAKGDLLNLLKQETRHRLRNVALELVELSSGSGKLIQKGSDPAEIIQAEEDLAELESRFAEPLIPESVLANASVHEAKVIELMRQGERKTSVFAETLGIGHLPSKQQKREVKRVKDRLKRRIERAGVPD